MERGKSLEGRQRRRDIHRPVRHGPHTLNTPITIYSSHISNPNHPIDCVGTTVRLSMRVGSTNSSLTAQPLCGMRPKISHETEDTGTGTGTGTGPVPVPVPVPLEQAQHTRAMRVVWRRAVRIDNELDRGHRPSSSARKVLLLAATCTRTGQVPSMTHGARARSPAP